MIKVLIADEQLIFRESLKVVIEQDPEIRVVGCAQNGVEAFKMCSDQGPDMVLMDILLPEHDGIEGIRLIKSKYPSVKVLMLTKCEGSDCIRRAFNYGAEGYLLKDINPKLLISAIKSVYNNMPVIHKNALDEISRILKENTENGVMKEIESTFEENKPENSIQLTQKEHEIVKLIAQGKTNKEIASSIYLSHGRVANIISSIFQKTGAADRTQLAIYAITNNIVQKQS